MASQKTAANKRMQKTNVKHLQYNVT